ncbi:MAG: hypothetical protein VKJ09_15735 [Leptolyngbya sp.]|nr:hypothetical protein [Leptolyngbya sp.]
MMRKRRGIVAIHINIDDALRQGVFGWHTDGWEGARGLPHLCNRNSRLFNASNRTNTRPADGAPRGGWALPHRSWRRSVEATGLTQAARKVARCGLHPTALVYLKWRATTGTRHHLAKHGGLQGRGSSTAWAGYLMPRHNQRPTRTAHTGRLGLGMQIVTRGTRLQGLTAGSNRLIRYQVGYAPGGGFHQSILAGIHLGCLTTITHQKCRFTGTAAQL